jgi:hypothetical protein
MTATQEAQPRVDHNVFAPVAENLNPTMATAPDPNNVLQSSDGALFVVESASQISGSSGQIAIGCRTKQSDKDFHSKVERLKTLEAQGMAIRYAASRGLSSPSFNQLPQTVATNKDMVPIHIARQRKLDVAPAGFISIFKVTSSNRGGA